MSVRVISITAIERCLVMCHLRFNPVIAHVHVSDPKDTYKDTARLRISTAIF